VEPAQWPLPATGSNQVNLGRSPWAKPGEARTTPTGTARPGGPDTSRNTVVDRLKDESQRSAKEARTYSPILYVIEVYEHLVPEPLAELRPKSDWSEHSIYEIAGLIRRHGVLRGSICW
jgi:hypothetical protein